MELSHKRELTVGGLVIAAIVVFVLGTSWLGGRPIGGDSDEYWNVQFQDVGGLKVSSPVRVSGVAVGRVEAIELQEAGKVRVAVSLNERIVPKIDATAEIVSIGFVGDAAVSLDPGKAPQPLSRDRTIIGTQAAGLASRAELLGDRADSVLIGMQALVNKQTADELRETMNALQATLKASERTMAVYSNTREGPTAEITKLMASLRNLTARLDSTLANPSLANVFHRADTLMTRLTVMTERLTAMSSRMDTLLIGINSGRGSLGRFATDTTLFVSMRDAGQSLKEFLDDLRQHPGKLSPTIKACVIPFAC